MTLTIAVIAPGAMGSAVARRLGEHGARVLTQFAGRSQATVDRAAAAGMIAASDAEIAAADIILSIVPPGEAVALAERLAGPITAAVKKPVFVDCNAVNVATVEAIAGIIAPTGAAFVDAGIIGLPPMPGTKGPVFHVSGAAAHRLACLRDLGLDLRVIDGPVGAASALKMSYAGINKGFTALGAAIALAATRAGADAALRAELAASQPQMLARLERALPDMIPKAYRWVAEMREISGFLGPDDPAGLIFEGCARLFEHIAKEKETGGEDIARIIAFAESGRVRVDA
ncbi:NAD(P)-dependent oxidoreductase [Bradyrhizobium sp.]|uniref:NAD(P)-dependent oxidoreductase n=1 Tax=Bradyrhizobium sp. TaxID=376 RepID=UPI001ECCE0C2|nr:NAD(P)-dependent oxidoreductase [Bradyrhizobium sp.]MBV9981746.1 NAD(P)-dependent oxidoreductase [Bradyrhizobium sp.]